MTINNQTEIDGNYIYNTVLVVSHLNGKDLIRVDTIVHCKIEEKYCNLYLNNGSKYIVPKGINEVMKKLPNHKFIKTSNTQIVNIDFINRYVKAKENYLLMHDGSKIVVGVSEEKIFDDLIKPIQFF
jgi:two-component system, LytTR family, response regulator